MVDFITKLLLIAGNVRLTEFGPQFSFKILFYFILFSPFSLLVSTLKTKDGVWHDVTVTIMSHMIQSQ